MNNGFKNELALYLSKPVEILYYNSIDSTNTEAKRLIKSGKTGDILIVAAKQTEGRGRQGKSFYSPEGTGIYFSLVFGSLEKPPLSVTTAAAVSVCRAVEKLTDKKPEIKWVNDIYLSGKKVCGILAEAVSLENRTAAIVGIGINLTTADFPESVENGGSLGFFGSVPKLVAEIVNGLYKTAFLPTGEYIEYYRTRSMLTGKKVYLIENGKKTPAAALGISDTGALRVRLENGEICEISSGDVTVREE